MWHFDAEGFVSVVAYDPKKDFTKNSAFSTIAKSADTHLLVRARVKADLDMLKRVCPKLVIETDPSADYAYRAVLKRSMFKRFLAESVDRIDYDSHFKEVARDRSPKAQDRYSAMMSTWTAMSKLQDHAPYGGTTYGYGGGYGTTYSGSYDYGNSNNVKTPAAISKGHKSMQDFLDSHWVFGDGTYLDGNGPRHGFKIGDHVKGYIGKGKVTGLQIKGGDLADNVTVTDSTGTKRYVTSNFLVPDPIPEASADWEVPEDLLPYINLVTGELIDPEDADDGDGLGVIHDMEWMYDHMKNNLSYAVGKFDSAELTNLDDDAFELLTRCAEALNITADDDDAALDTIKISAETLEEIYDEIKWESANEAERKVIAGAGKVPARYEQDALKLYDTPIEEEVESS